MQINLTFSLPNKIILPLAYQHSLQALIYKALETSDSDYSAFLHNIGYQKKYSASTAKLFCYGLLKGSSTVSPPKITFTDNISFEVRSPMDEFCQTLISGFSKTDIWELNGHPIILTKIETGTNKISSHDIRISMNSPLCTHMTYYEGERRKTLYLNPMNYEIQTLLNRNLESKYLSAYGKKPESPLKFSCGELSSKDKFVTTFKNIKITAWSGTYKLSGDQEILTFLYDSGLGTRNAQGFGMFDVL